jgi:hypothetical protein
MPGPVRHDAVPALRIGEAFISPKEERNKPINDSFASSIPSP